jgi:hypothetical protein
MFATVYLALNAAGFYWFDKDPAYPNLLEWDCFWKKEEEDDVKCDIWAEFFMFLTMFVGGMVFFSLLIVTIHRYKVRCCCWKADSSNSNVKIHLNDG